MSIKKLIRRTVVCVDKLTEEWDQPHVIHEDIPNLHGEEAEAAIKIDLLESYRNFPKDRGFVISRMNNIWRANDDKGNMYWLNTSNCRWIQMIGPDRDLPRNALGDCNFTDPEQYRDFEVDEHGYFIFKDPTKEDSDDV